MARSKQTAGSSAAVKKQKGGRLNLRAVTASVKEDSNGKRAKKSASKPRGKTTDTVKMIAETAPGCYTVFWDKDGSMQFVPMDKAKETGTSSVAKPELVDMVVGTTTPKEELSTTDSASETRTLHARRYEMRTLTEEEMKRINPEVDGVIGDSEAIDILDKMTAMLTHFPDNDRLRYWTHHLALRIAEIHSNEAVIQYIIPLCGVPRGDGRVTHSSFNTAMAAADKLCKRTKKLNEFYIDGPLGEFMGTFSLYDMESETLPARLEALLNSVEAHAAKCAPDTDSLLTRLESLLDRTEATRVAGC